jgi:hypothetical protein
VTNPEQLHKSVSIGGIGVGGSTNAHPHEVRKLIYHRNSKITVGYMENNN